MHMLQWQYTISFSVSCCASSGVDTDGLVPDFFVLGIPACI